MKNGIKLFPYALARIAGDSFTEFGKLNLHQTLTIIQSIEKMQHELDQIKETLSEALHSYIATVSDVKQRNALIQLRRDIHNERLTALSIQFEKILPVALSKKIKPYLVLQEKKQKLLVTGELTFKKEKIQSKKIFLQILKKENFRNGIILASSTLPESLERYVREAKKPLPKIERSLMKYLSRMYTKPSPFSTFTLLAHATFSGNAMFSSNDKKMTKDSHVELNHYLFHYICGLLIQNKKIRKYLRVRLNPTLLLSEKQYVFLANNFNRESIQRINQTPALDAIHLFMQQQENWIYSDIVHQLLTQKFTTVSQQEMEEYMDNLLLYGFAEYDFGISGMDNDWDKKLSALITPLIKQFPYLNELKKMLALLRTSAKKYETATTIKRKKILYETFIAVRRTCLLLHTKAELPKKERESFTDKYVPEEKNREKAKKNNNHEELFKYEYETKFALKSANIWYEDYALASVTHLSKSVEDSLNTFSQLLSHMGWFDTCLQQVLYYTDFFKKNYKKTEKVNLLTFYESYHRMDKKKKKREKNELIEESNKKNKEFFKMFDKKWKRRSASDGTVVLKKADISFIPRHTKHASFGSYFHLMQNADGKSMIILNHIAPGFGKMYSRFLTLFPDAVTQTIRRWNREIDTKALLAEVTDSSVFNANLHPNLMPYEIASPGSHIQLPAKKIIAMEDIEIVYKKNDKRVHLVHKKDQKEIFMFDLGFQGSGGRSGIFNFLSKFTVGSHHHIEPLIEHINTHYTKEKSDVVILPRIVYEDHVVLQRKTWDITKNILPKRLPQESDWLYFQKIISWKNTLSLPDEIFVKHVYDKPQYINFANPFLITIFEKMIEKMKEKDRLKIQEMLPASEDLFSMNGEKFVTEFLTQWYC